MRVAGEGTHYELAILDGGGRAASVALKLPSVTTILKALPKYGLEWWGYRMGLVEGRRMAVAPPVPGDWTTMDEAAFYDAVKKLGRDGGAVTPSNALTSAGSRGSDVHSIVERLFTEHEVPVAADVVPELRGYRHALVKWYEEVLCPFDFKQVILCEKAIFSLDHRYAGTLDLLYVDDDGIYHVVDFKTSKAVYESHLLQSTAYLQAAREMGLISPDGEARGEVVRLGAKGDYEVQTSAFQIGDFLQVKAVWEWLERTKERSKV